MDAEWAPGMKTQAHRNQSVPNACGKFLRFSKLCCPPQLAKKRDPWWTTFCVESHMMPRKMFTLPQGTMMGYEALSRKDLTQWIIRSIDTTKTSDAGVSPMRGSASNRFYTRYEHYPFDTPFEELKEKDIAKYFKNA